MEKHLFERVDFKAALNDAQYEVVTSAEGPSLVLAGAGSGKTRTLIYRLAYLLERGVRPENILLMTFTNKAAREMRERIASLLGYEPKGLWSGTFHHVGNRSLRIYAPKVGYKRDFGILDEHDSRELIKASIKKKLAGMKDEKFPKPAVIHAIISLSANTEKTVKKVIDDRYPYFMKFEDSITAIKDEYEKKKESSGNMDYDDLLSKWKWLLENVPEARERFGEQFKYIMVDEYQDTNFLQADIVDILAEHHKNVLVVGDDAQSIYSFRGAQVENILNFPHKFAGTKVFKLETNYRSTPEILNLANDSLLNNENQFEKELKAVKAVSKRRPVLVEVRDAYSQARFVAKKIDELIASGMELKDMAVLFRAHFQSAELEMELIKRGIPYIVRGGIRFFEQAHVKDVLSYLKITANPIDEVAWVRALTLSAGIGPGYAQKIYENFRKSGMELSHFIKSKQPAGIPKKAEAGYVHFRKIMEAILSDGENRKAGEMISLVLEEGYRTHLYAAYDNAKDRLDDLNELVNFSHEYDDTTGFLSDITLREGFRGDVVESSAPGAELVLSTIHQAKGLEWGAVFLIGLSEGQFPHSKSFGNAGEMEEERRLFYVAVTRAKEALYLIHPAMRYDHERGMILCGRSIFLDELDRKDYEEWREGNDGL